MHPYLFQSWRRQTMQKICQNWDAHFMHFHCYYHWCVLVFQFYLFYDQTSLLLFGTIMPGGNLLFKKRGCLAIEVKAAQRIHYNDPSIVFLLQWRFLLYKTAVLMFRLNKSPLYQVILYTHGYRLYVPTSSISCILTYVGAAMKKLNFRLYQTYRRW